MMEFLRRILWELHPDVDPESTEDLVVEGILDSFDIVTIVAEVSAELGVNIPAEELIPENFASLSRLCALIQRLEEY